MKILKKPAPQKQNESLEPLDVDASLDEIKEKHKKDRTQLTIFILGVITFILLSTFIVFLWRDIQKKSSREDGSQPERYVAEQNGETTTNISTKYDEKIKNTMKKMSLEQKVYQLFMVSPEALCDGDYVTVAGETTQKMISERPVGGIIYHLENLMTADQVTEMLEKTQSYSTLPLFMAVEEEGGAANSPIAYNSGFEVTQNPDMATIGSFMESDRAFDVGDSIGTYLKNLGFNLDLAPVSDVLVNTNNFYIGNRAFSDSADVVSKMVTQEVLGLKKNKVSATLKHFPGEGSLTTNPKIDYQVVNDQSLEDIEYYNLPPFKAGIAAGADFVMVTHSQIPALTGDNDPGCLSEEVVDDLLRNKLKFGGVIITDTMKATSLLNFCPETEACVKAIQAGCDMILDPTDLVGCADAVLSAVQKGTITKERLDQSVERILRVKYENISFSIAGKNTYAKKVAEEKKKAEEEKKKLEEQANQTYDPAYDPYYVDPYYDPYYDPNYVDPYYDPYYDPNYVEPYYDPYYDPYYVEPYYDPYAY